MTENSLAPKLRVFPVHFLRGVYQSCPLAASGTGDLLGAGCSAVAPSGAKAIDKCALNCTICVYVCV